MGSNSITASTADYGGILSYGGHGIGNHGVWGFSGMVRFGMSSVARRLATALAFLAVSATHAAVAAGDGAWRLTIEGHQTFLFGEARFGGGIRVPWEVVIEFEVRQGEYGLGSGSARWLRNEEMLSRPPGWFVCSQVDGTYLDSNLALHETPRVRFAAFPVAGELRDGRILLQPGYEAPGNYLAVIYECMTENPIAENWFALAERGKQVLGKRQDAETRRDAARQVARVREVAALPPESQLDLPLEAGWTFSQGAADGDRRVTYNLRQLK